MAKIPLLNGAYAARSVIANAQRAVNLYCELNPKDAESPTTHYPTPGLTLRANAGSSGGWRCLYRASNGELFGINGATVYYIDSSWNLTSLGLITLNTTPASMQDNGTTLVVVDGTGRGYTVDLTSHAFAQIVDPNFFGSVHVDYLDTYLLFGQPNTRNFYSSLSNSVAFDALYLAAKTAYPDKLVAVYVTHRDIWLIGDLRTEIWYNAGTAGFPFALTPGAYVDIGCVAKYSIATHGKFLFWLSQDKDGRCIVVRAKAYESERISTFAIENAISSYTAIDDAVGYVYQQEGHIFYVLNFPSANSGRGATWVYDLQSPSELPLWHERVWLDTQGRECRHRGQCATNAYGKIVVGDWENGNLYTFELDVYTDNGSPIVRRRGFMHITAEGERVSFETFQADIEAGTDDGTIDGTSQTSPPQIFLRWSDDRGKTFGTPVPQSLGAVGQYLVQPQWNRLGYARDRVFELFWSCPTKTALNGAYLHGIAAEPTVQATPPNG